MKERISGFDFGQEGIIDVKFVRETGTKLVQAKCISKNFTRFHENWQSFLVLLKICLSSLSSYSKLWQIK